MVWAPVKMPPWELHGGELEAATPWQADEWWKDRWWSDGARERGGTYVSDDVQICVVLEPPTTDIEWPEPKPEASHEVTPRVKADWFCAPYLLTSGRTFAVVTVQPILPTLGDCV